MILSVLDSGENQAWQNLRRVVDTKKANYEGTTLTSPSSVPLRSLR